MENCCDKAHYDYMTVRADDIEECRYYSAFGWTYVADESERGGRYSFRRISCPCVQRRLDELQSECEALLKKLKKVRDHIRFKAALPAAAAILLGLIAFINGMNLCTSAETLPFGAAISVAGGVLAVAAAFPIFTRAAADVRAGGEEERALKSNIARICGEARRILGKSR